MSGRGELLVILVLVICKVAHVTRHLKLSAMGGFLLVVWPCEDDLSIRNPGQIKDQMWSNVYDRINQDGRRLYVGIHTGSDGLQTNYGTRYSSEVHAFVVNAMATL